MRRLKSVLARDGGSAIIETAAALTVLLMLFFGVMDCSRALYADLYVGYASHAATRYAMVRGSTWTGNSCADTTSANCDATVSDIARVVQTMAPLGVDTAAPLTVTTTWPGTTASGSPCVMTSGANSPGCVVEVAVSYKFTFVLPFLPRDALAIKSSSAVTIAQ